MEEVKKTIKIDSYDFFGYLVPGLIFLVVLMLAHFQFAQVDNPKLITDFGCTLKELSTSWLIATFAAGVISAYIFGHAIATIASLFFERIMVKCIFGYPYKRLLFKFEDIESSTRPKTFVLFVYSTAAFLIFMQDYLHTVYTNLEHKVTALLSVFIYLLLATACTLVFHKKIAIIFNLVEGLVLYVTGAGKPFPDKMKELLRKKFLDTFKFSIDDADTESFWATYWHVVTENDYVRAKIDKWMVLYSFVRNVGAALLISSIAIAIVNIVIGGQPLLRLHSELLFILSILVVARYYYLYYSYYTKSVFRAFLFVSAGGPAQTEHDQLPQ